MTAAAIEAAVETAVIEAVIAVTTAEIVVTVAGVAMTVVVSGARTTDVQITTNAAPTGSNGATTIMHGVTGQIAAVVAKQQRGALISNASSAAWKRAETRQPHNIGAISAVLQKVVVARDLVMFAVQSDGASSGRRNVTVAEAAQIGPSAEEINAAMAGAINAGQTAETGTVTAGVTNVEPIAAAVAVMLTGMGAATSAVQIADVTGPPVDTATPAIAMAVATTATGMDREAVMGIFVPTTTSSITVMDMTRLGGYS